MVCGGVWRRVEVLCIMLASVCIQNHNAADGAAAQFYASFCSPWSLKNIVLTALFKCVPLHFSVALLPVN